MEDFTVWAGVESDILREGQLDYDDEILAKLDFVIASIHSGFNMSKKEATERLIKAIENKHTHILGHPTGRLLLIREGYPVDHKKIIKACAQSNVAIEINANPKRLDLDWQWLPYAIEQEVMISINPDAHSYDGIHDVTYGVYTGQKGGLPKSLTLNHFSTEALQHYFSYKERPQFA